VLRATLARSGLRGRGLGVRQGGGGCNGHRVSCMPRGRSWATDFPSPSRRSTTRGQARPFRVGLKLTDLAQVIHGQRGRVGRRAKVLPNGRNVQSRSPSHRGTAGRGTKLADSAGLLALERLGDDSSPWVSRVGNATVVVSAATLSSCSPRRRSDRRVLRIAHM
jgi:hypothetical protein